MSARNVRSPSGIVPRGILWSSQSLRVRAVGKVLAMWCSMHVMWRSSCVSQVPKALYVFLGHDSMASHSKFRVEFLRPMIVNQWQRLKLVIFLWLFLWRYSREPRQAFGKLLSRYLHEIFARSGKHMRIKAPCLLCRCICVYLWARREERPTFAWKLELLVAELNISVNVLKTNVNIDWMKIADDNMEKCECSWRHSGAFS